MSNRGLARSFDTDNAGGGILTVPMARTVFCNNFNVSLDMVLPKPHGFFPHVPPADAVPATTTSVFAENLRVVREGDIALCGHPVVPGSPNTYVGD